ncbi:MAG TPA: MFS transporter, partial [Chloroflexota bacterium]|nr:MFS transporter [Chloroflexota bacterium]
TLPRLSRQSVPTLDLPGMLLAPLAFVALSYGVTQGASSWTSPETIGGIIVGLVALCAFALVELRSRNPLLELRVFRSFDFSVAIVTQWVAQFALFGALYLVPLFLQQVRGYGAFDTGLSLLPQALSSAVFMPLGGVLFDKIGARPLVVVSGAIMAVASFLLATVGNATQGHDLILPLALYGAGMGLMLMPLNTQVINAAPRKLVGKVTSLTNALQQVINSLTIAGLTTILISRPGYHRAQQLLAAPHPVHAPAPAPGAGLPAPVQALFATAFDDTFHLMAFVAIFGGLLGFVLRRRLAAHEADSEEEEQAPLAHMMAG